MKSGFVIKLNNSFSFEGIEQKQEQHTQTEERRESVNRANTNDALRKVSYKEQDNHIPKQTNLNTSENFTKNQFEIMKNSKSYKVNIIEKNAYYYIACARWPRVIELVCKN